MSKKPKVSVVIPVFNGAAFIARAVESVLAQTFKDFEIVIIDDGSSDNTQTVLEQFSNQPNIRCLYQENAGPAHARNVGVKSASGDYIAFLDCDDMWFPEKLELQMAIFGESDSAGLIHSNYEVIASDGEVIQYAKAGHTRDVFHQTFTGGHAPLLSTTVVSRTIFEQIGGFDSALWVSEDSDLILRLYDVTTFECLDRTLVHKFQRVEEGEKKSRRGAQLGSQVLSSRERFLRHVQARLSLSPEQQGVLNREWSSLFLMKGECEAGKGKWGEARKHYLAAITADPFRFRGYSRFLRAIRL